MADIELKLTGGVAIDGVIHRPGATIAVGPKMARELIARGKAVLSAVAPAEGDQTAEVVDLTDEALKDLAQEYGLKLPKKFDRARWVAAIEAHEGGAAGEDGAE